jgi:hypothetical protein
VPQTGYAAAQRAFRRSLNLLDLQLVRISSCVARVMATYSSRACSSSDPEECEQKPILATAAARYCIFH